MFFSKIPTEKGKIFERTIKGVTYIYYEYDRVYKPDKKYNIPKRTTIGKKCEDDGAMMYPNLNFMKYFPDAELPVDEGRAERSSYLRLVTFMLIIIPFFSPGYKIYSDATVSEFIGQISVDDSVEFQNEWNALKKNKDKIYISYDSTNKNCQAGDIELVEYGYAKDDEVLPVFNYSIAYDCNNREPLFYEDYPGSIVDVSQLQCMLDKAMACGYKNAGFILDRGYFSRENIRYMDKCGYDIVIMVKGMKALVNDAVKEVRGTFEDSRQYTIRRFGVNGTTVERTVFPSDERNRYLHIYYSYSKAAAEREQLEQKIDKLAAYFKKLEG